MSLSDAIAKLMPTRLDAGTGFDVGVSKEGTGLTYLEFGQMS